MCPKMNRMMNKKVSVMCQAMQDGNILLFTKKWGELRKEWDISKNVKYSKNTLNLIRELNDVLLPALAWRYDENLASILFCDPMWDKVMRKERLLHYILMYRPLEVAQDFYRVFKDPTFTMDSYILFVHKLKRSSALVVFSREEKIEVLKWLLSKISNKLTPQDKSYLLWDALSVDKMNAAVFWIQQGADKDQTIQRLKQEVEPKNFERKLSILEYLLLEDYTKKVQEQKPLQNRDKKRL